MANRKKDAPSAVAAALGANVDKLRSPRQETAYHANRQPHKPMAVIYDWPDGRRCIVRGMNARTLVNLCQKDGEGITHADVLEWARYLPAYISELRKRHRLDIRSMLEPHIGGSHARYVLLSPIKLIDIFDG